jgi:hypothetical protein
MIAHGPVARVASVSIPVPRFLLAIALGLLVSGCASLPKNVEREPQLWIDFLSIPPVECYCKIAAAAATLLKNWESAHIARALRRGP